MLPLLFLGGPIAGAWLWSYGGVRGPVDWLSRSTLHRAGSAAGRVALTFDDGPDPARTPLLLDVLSVAGVRATFFLVGRQVDRYPELARRIAAEGHQIGNHTYTHAYLPLHRGRTVDRQLDQTDRAIADATGLVPDLVRPPYGGRTLRTIRAFRRSGKRVVLWDVNSFDWRGGSVEEICTRVLDRVRPGSIVLLHEARRGGEISVEAVRRLIPALRARGLEPTTIAGLTG